MSPAPDRAEQPGSTPSRSGRRLRIGACEIDRERLQCHLNGEPVPVRRPVLELICLLVERRPAIVTHADILRHVWPRVPASHQVVVRAIVDARRTIGDDAKESRYIVNVHGVGYRFAGPVDEDLPPASGPTELQDDPAHHVAARLLKAREAFIEGGGIEVSQRHAESALLLALQHGLSLERGRALYWLGWVSLYTDNPEMAARHLGHAKQLADDERDEHLQARIRVADGLLRSFIGDLDRAQSQLAEAHERLLHVGIADMERHHCENGLACVAVELGQWEAAQQWSACSIQTALDCGELQQARHYRLQGLLIDLRAGDAHERADKPEHARRLWAASLARCEALLQDEAFAAPADGIAPRCRWEVELRHGALLARLGRLTEAHQVIEALALAWSDEPKEPGRLEIKRMEVYVELARLLQRESRIHEALRVLEWGLAHFEEDSDWTELNDMYSFAADVAQRCGRFDLALHWSRNQLAAQRKDEARRLRLLTRVVRADGLQDELSRELGEVQQRIAELEQQAAAMLTRLAER